MRLYDSLSRDVQEVVPVEPGRVNMYTCGPTVYRWVHLGNLRTFLLGDLIRRALEFEGHDVTQALNITDVGVVRSMRELWGRRRAAGRAQR